MFTTCDAELRALGMCFHMSLVFFFISFPLFSYSCSITCYNQYLDNEKLKELAGQRGRCQMYALRAICSAIVQRSLGSDGDVQDIMKHLYKTSGHDPWIQRLGSMTGEESSFVSDPSLHLVNITGLRQSVAKKRKREYEDTFMKLNKLAKKYISEEKNESRKTHVQKEIEQDSETCIESDHQEEIKKCCNLLREYVF